MPLAADTPCGPPVVAETGRLGGAGAALSLSFEGSGFSLGFRV